MHKKAHFICAFLIWTLMVSFLLGCSGSDDSTGKHTRKRHTEESRTEESRTTSTEVLSPVASGAVVYGNEIVSIDASNTSEGYVMVQYTGGADKVKLQITAPDGDTYSYNLAIGSYETFPLSAGNGTYQLTVLEHAYDDMYAVSFSQDIDVAIADEFKPFLYPNQYVWFTSENKAVALGVKLSEESSSDLDYVGQVYHYVTENITYDEELAENAQADYLPDIDSTLNSGKGICFDYASLMAAMLRSQNIPTKLVVGYSGDAYHAWISVYLTETGWIDKVIEFDGTSWSLIDPTLAANNSASSVRKYIGDGSNYIVKYSY